MSVKLTLNKDQLILVTESLSFYGHHLDNAASPEVKRVMPSFYKDLKVDRARVDKLLARCIRHGKKQIKP